VLSLGEGVRQGERPEVEIEALALILQVGGRNLPDFGMGVVVWL